MKTCKVKEPCLDKQVVTNRFPVLVLTSEALMANKGKNQSWFKLMGEKGSTVWKVI